MNGFIESKKSALAKVKQSNNPNGNDYAIVSVHLHELALKQADLSKKNEDLARKYARCAVSLGVFSTDGYVFKEPKSRNSIDLDMLRNESVAFEKLYSDMLSEHIASFDFSKYLTKSKLEKWDKQNALLTYDVSKYIVVEKSERTDCDIAKKPSPKDKP